MSISDFGIRVVDDGIVALEKLKAEFPTAAFDEAVDFIANKLKGKVVVASMGKPGYIAHRLAATLSSTGIKSVYLHVAEASHGDMGVIADDDCVVMISNSGETKESFDVINYTRRFGIKLVAITSVMDSTLGRQADIVIKVPEVAESCLIGKAPSTSIIIISAMANALIVALEGQTNISPDQYREWHPHGALGASLLKVSSLMHSGDEVPLLSETASMDEIVDVMSRPTHFGCVGAVASDGRLSGIFTDGDIRRKLKEGVDLKNARLCDVMFKAPKSIREDALAASATKVMNDLRIQALFVLDNDGRPVGIVNFHDMLKAGLV